MQAHGFSVTGTRRKKVFSSKKIQCPAAVPVLESWAVPQSVIFGADATPLCELGGPDKILQLGRGKVAVRSGEVALSKRIFGRIPPLAQHSHPITPVSSFFCVCYLPCNDTKTPCLRLAFSGKRRC